MKRAEIGGGQQIMHNMIQKARQTRIGKERWVGVGMWLRWGLGEGRKAEYSGIYMRTKKKRRVTFTDTVKPR